MTLDFAAAIRRLHELAAARRALCKEDDVAAYDAATKAIGDQADLIHREPPHSDRDCILKLKLQRTVFGGLDDDKTDEKDAASVDQVIEFLLNRTQ